MEIRTGIVFAVLTLAAAPLLAQGPLRPRPRPPGSSAPQLRSPPAAPTRSEPEHQDRGISRYEPPTDPLLVKAIEASVAFRQGLPDFVCRERMLRFSSRNVGKTWKQNDVVEAEVLTLAGKAEYRDIRVDGKPTGATALSQIGGSWSIGDYGAVVVNLFNRGSRARLAKQGSAKVGDREALVYDYKIEQEYSSWTIGADGRSTIAAHHGKVWLDAETGRTLRVETEAIYLPYDFPVLSNTRTLEFDDVEIGGRHYLLPSRAENTSCRRGSGFCSRLEIEFLDYRKFTSESSLFTTDSDIEFGEEVPEP